MLTCVNKTLKEATTDKSLKRGKVNVPGHITKAEARSLMLICEILQPLAEWTDDLQSDGVTASKAVYGLIDTVRSMLIVYVICEDKQ